MLSRDRATEIAAHSAGKRILVVGDLMLDRYVSGCVERISPEAPVPVLLVQDERTVPGGASNVAWNIGTLGGVAAAAGILGQDAAGEELCRLLDGVGVDVAGVLREAGTKTTVKTRIVADRQQLVRIDRESTGELSADVLTRFCEVLVKEVARSDGVIIEDYGKGVVQQQVVDVVLREAARRGIPTGYDPKENHELNVGGITVATPNRKESFLAAGVADRNALAEPQNDAKVEQVAAALYQKWRPEWLLLTLGAQGMLVVQGGKLLHHVPTRAREVFDVSGAGDTVIAATVLALAAGATPIESAEYANYAAGVVVAKSGTAPCPVDELLRTVPN